MTALRLLALCWRALWIEWQPVIDDCVWAATLGDCDLYATASSGGAWWGDCDGERLIPRGAVLCSSLASAKRAAVRMALAAAWRAL